ncbi:hypothetical protein ACFL6C_14160, partial [Myxococcota bacterium]
MRQAVRHACGPCSAQCENGYDCQSLGCTGSGAHPTCTPYCDRMPDGTPCDDGNACTDGETCESGTCQGGSILDNDNDGYSPESCGGGDCDDGNGSIHPGQSESGRDNPTCSDDLDNDCDGLIDDEESACLGCTQDSHCDDSDPCT